MFALLLLLGLNLRRGLNHDEHQFIAAGKLMAEGLQPYADFPYFHLPGLGLLNAALFARIPALLLGARLTSILWAWLGLALLFGFVYRRLADGVRLVGAAALVILLLAAPLFVHTSGRAWNHDLPILLLVLACLTFERAVAVQPAAAPGSSPGLPHHVSRPVWLFLTGCLLGLATCVRLSFALMVPAFGLALPLHAWRRLRAAATTGGYGWRQWFVDCAFLGLGCVVGLGPAWPLAWQNPDAFWFGNFEYIRLNTDYYRSLPQPPVAMNLPGKLLYLGQLFLLQPGNFLLIAVAIVVASPARLVDPHRESAGRDQPERRAWPALALLLPPLWLMALLSGLAATPSQWQYFYPLLPLTIMGASVGLAAQPLATQRRRIRWLVAAAGLAALLAIPSYAPGLAILLAPGEWTPWQVHTRSATLATLVDGGRVLTLAPVYVLEGNTPIEPALATGPFAWRVAEAVEPTRRQRLGLLAPSDLPAYWAEQPPRAVLVGAQEDDAREEAPLVAQAEQAGYLPVQLPDETTLWLSPLAAWDETIQLGGHTLPRQPVAPGTAVAATFYLQAMHPITVNLNVLVRLVDQAGVELVRAEGWPWGAATSSWAPGAVWPDGHTFQLPATTAPGVYRVEMGFYDPVTLATLGDFVAVDYLLVGQPAPAATVPLAEFGDALQLLDARVTHQVGATGGIVQVQLTWQASQRPPADYTSFVHLLAPGGQLIAQEDQPPLAGFYPTRRWRPDFPLTDTILVPLPAGAPAGPYQVLVGLYEPTSGQRLPARQGETEIGDALMVGTISLAQ